MTKRLDELMKVTVYPRTWKNKTNGKKVRVMPWWETIKDGEFEKVDELGKMISEQVGRICKFGVIVQVGYLIENEKGVWFGLGPSAIDSFDDLGVCKKRKKK